MSPYQTLQSSLLRRPNYLNTSSPKLDPVSSTGDEFQPYTDSSGSEFVPSSTPLAMRHGGTNLVASSVEASAAQFGNDPSYNAGFNSAIGLDGIKQPTASLRCPISLCQLGFVRRRVGHLRRSGVPMPER
ncbi:hypothetical protein PG988_003208 [Apiospora saccharicola]